MCVCVCACVCVFPCVLITDQMNTTVHRTMGSSPYEIAFGQPPHGTVFPGAVGSVNEEGVEELLVGGNEESSCVGRDQDRSAAFQHANRVEGSCEQVMSLGETTAIDSSTSDEESRLRREEFRLDIGEENFVHDFSDQASSEDEVEDNDGEDGGEEEEEEEEVEEEDVPVLGKHTAVRRAANLRYCANAEKLLNKFSAAKGKRIAVFALGDTISVKIPGIDRVGADALRVPGKIVEVCKGDLFRIRTASGVLGSCFRHDCLELFRGECAILVVGFDKIGPFFWHFMLLALPFVWPNYANFHALLAEKCSLMLDILNSNSVKHDLTINLITMAEYVPGMAAKIAGTLSYECIPTSIQSHAQRTTGTLSCTCTAPVRWKPNCIIKF